MLHQRLHVRGQLQAEPLPQLGRQDREGGSHRHAVTRALAALRNAERPVIIAGGGAVFSRCSASLQRFAELTGIPVAASTMARGVLPEARRRTWC